MEKINNNTLNTLKNSITPTFYDSLIHNEAIFNSQYNEILKQKHEIKFKKCTSTNVISETKFNDNWFINMSNINIPREIVQVVALGPKYNIPAEKIDKKTAFEFIQSAEQFILYYKINVTYQYKNDKLSNTYTKLKHF